MRIKLSALTGGGNYNDGSNAGVWFRYGRYSWLSGYSDYGFRAAGYAS